MAWERLGSVDPRMLGSERDTAHWATQIAAAAGSSLAAVRPDESHTSLEWRADMNALVGPELELAPCRAALRLADLHLMVLDRNGTVSAELPLVGRTLAGGIRWLGQSIPQRLDATRVDLVRPRHDLPDHPAAHSAPFAVANPAALHELARWYKNADSVLRALAAEASHESSVSPVRCWLDHFDISFLASIDAARSIGVGMAPGDANFGEPYFYVTPWPYPQTAERPAIEGDGEWHVDGWFGAVLPGSTICSDPDGDAQLRRTLGFGRSAIAACRRLLA